MNTKNIVINSIKEERRKAIEKYDNLEDLISLETRDPKLYELIVKIYNHNINQRSVAENFLKESLGDDFFKTATVKSSSHEVVFSSERYLVSFPLSETKNIAIVDKEIKRLPLVPIDLVPIESENKWTLKLIELIRIYLADNSFSNLKALNDHHKPNSKNENIIARMKNYHNSYKSFTGERLDLLVEEIELDIKRAEEELLKVEQHEKKLEESMEFAYSLKGLKEWKDCGWKVNHYEASLKLTLDYNNEDSTEEDI